MSVIAMYVVCYSIWLPFKKNTHIASGEPGQTQAPTHCFFLIKNGLVQWPKAMTDQTSFKNVIPLSKQTAEAPSHNENTKLKRVKGAGIRWPSRVKSNIICGDKGCTKVNPSKGQGNEANINCFHVYHYPITGLHIPTTASSKHYIFSIH